MSEMRDTANMGNSGLYKELIYREYNGTYPTDRIILDVEPARNLLRFGLKFNIDISNNGTDIFWAGSIPVYDCIISFPFGEARVSIDRDNIDNLNKELDLAENEHGKNVMLYVGGIAIALNGSENNPFRCVELAIKRGTDKIIMSNIYPQCIAGDKHEMTLFNFVYGIWYLIMIALLHPVTKKQILTNSVQERIETTTGNGNHKRNAIRYIRRINISEDDLSIVDELSGEKRKYNVLCWYVSGHWRHYKDGKVVFIKPYWKGELRETKKADETRLREIVTDGGQLC